MGGFNALLPDPDLTLRARQVVPCVFGFLQHTFMQDVSVGVHGEECLLFLFLCRKGIQHVSRH